MRIWFIFSVVIFSIVSIVSVIFLLFLEDINENRHAELLEYAHSFILSSLSNDTLYKKPFPQVEGMQHFTFNLRNEEVSFITNHAQQVNQEFIDWINQVVDAGLPTQNISWNNEHYLIKLSPIDKDNFLISYRNLDSNRFVGQIIIMGFMVIMFSLPIAKLIANNIARPLKQLETYTQQIANKEWHRTLHLKNEDEIGRLAKAMDDMKLTLQMADEEEKKFLQSISHDLKTPVMVIMSYAQAIIDGIYVDTAEETATIIKEEAIRLEKKIKQVLYLNTLDYVMENDKDQEDIYFAKLLSYLVHNFQTIAPKLDWQLSIAAKDARLQANPDRIRVAIENILENQLRFAHERVQIMLRQNHHTWEMTIENDGPHIPTEDLQQIFSHLYKSKQGHFGLGLEISKKIIEFYQGTIHAENLEGGGVRFTIRFVSIPFP